MYLVIFRYNAKLSVVENIKLPPTLLSRFDLIYLILDKPNEDQDRKLARHLVSLYYDDAEAEAKEVETNRTLQLVDQKFLRDYILYARNNICPEISDAAAEVIKPMYFDLFYIFCPVQQLSRGRCSFFFTEYTVLLHFLQPGACAQLRGDAFLGRS